MNRELIDDQAAHGRAGAAGAQRDARDTGAGERAVDDDDRRAGEVGSVVASITIESVIDGNALVGWIKARRRPVHREYRSRPGWHRPCCWRR
ncbi:MAG: hypothetical protein R3E48_13370 [Burkholderiaceae bacterium]